MLTILMESLKASSEAISARTGADDEASRASASNCKDDSEWDIVVPVTR